MAGQGDIPALESGMSGLFSAMTGSLRLPRRNFSYDEYLHDEDLDLPLHSQPPDVNMLWMDPIFPRRKFKKGAEEEGKGGSSITFEAASAAKPLGPVVKAKATSLMTSLMIKQTHESVERFEHQAGLTDAVYSPHKGLSEETRFHRLAEGTVPKLRMPSGDFKEDKLTTSAQSTPCGTPSVTPSVTPCVTPQASPALSRRSWFNQSPAPFLTPTTPDPSSASPSVDMGGNEGGGGGGTGTERWNFFGTRSVVQKSPTDPGSDSSPAFTLQSYLGLQKSSTLEGIKSQADDPANFLPPKIDISGIEAKRSLTRLHKLKPRDMNVLTPSGF